MGAKVKLFNGYIEAMYALSFVPVTYLLIIGALQICLFKFSHNKMQGHIDVKDEKYNLGEGLCLSLQALMQSVIKAIVDMRSHYEVMNATAQDLAFMKGYTNNFMHRGFEPYRYLNAAGILQNKVNTPAMFPQGMYYTAGIFGGGMTPIGCYHLSNLQDLVTKAQAEMAVNPAVPLPPQLYWSLCCPCTMRTNVKLSSLLVCSFSLATAALCS